MKFFLLIFILSCLQISGKSQFAVFDFNSSPQLSVSYCDTSIVVSRLALSSGAIDTNITTGTYFTDEPYIQETGGWDKSSAMQAKSFMYSVSAKQGYSISPSKIYFECYATSAGPSAVSIIIDDSVLVDIDIPSSSLIVVDTTIDVGKSDTFCVKIAGWQNGSRSTSGSGTLRIDNVKMYGDIDKIEAPDTLSFIKVTNYTTPDTLLSVINSPSYEKVMQFSISDPDTGDRVSTVVDSFIITSNSEYDLHEVFDRVFIVLNSSEDTVEGEIFCDTILFNNQIVVKDGSVDTLSLYISLRTELPGIDNKKILLSSDFNDFYCNKSGSKISKGQVNINFTVNVEATKTVVLLPDVLCKDSVFNISVYATDANGNIDTDIASKVSLFLGKYPEEGKQTECSNYNRGVVKFTNQMFFESDTFLMSIYSEFDTIEKVLYVPEQLFYEDFESNTLERWYVTGNWEVEDSISLGGMYSLHHIGNDSAEIDFISAKYRKKVSDQATTVWQFTISNDDFNPSSSNAFWYRVMANNSDLSLKSNFGYVVGVNFTGYNDSLSLWRVDSSGVTKLIVQTDYRWGNSDTVSIEIVRTARGKWIVGYSQGTYFSNLKYSEGIVDNSYCNLRYHGVVFKHTSSRSGMLWCDNVSTVVYNTPPFIKEILTIDNNTIALTFSEDVDSISACNIGNYNVVNEKGERLCIDKISPLNAEGVLIYVSTMNTGQYSLEEYGVKDMEGLPSCTDRVSFYHKAEAQQHDIIINEIMFDPTPAVELPTTDYIEIYNRSEKKIDIGGWLLYVDNTQKTFPSELLLPDDYLLITASSFINDFSDSLNKVALISSTALTLSGKAIKIVSEKGTIIDSLFYKREWYGDEAKSDGGWSLERINTEGMCKDMVNWRASIDSSGGTPGYVNSVKSDIIDRTPPKIEKALICGDSLINLFFSKPIDSLSVHKGSVVINDIDIGIFTVEKGCLVVYSSTPFSDKSTIHISVTNITDYCGNVIEDTTLELFYHKAGVYDLVINEIMATPLPSAGLPGVEYVELYNRTSVPVTLYDAKLCVGTTLKNIPVTTLLPYSYYLITDIADSLIMSDYGEIIEIENMQTLRSSGKVSIITSDEQVICKTEYSKTMFDDDFKSEGGYSLERIDYNNSDETSLNWKGSIADRGGTPGKVNSIFCKETDSEPPEIVTVFPVNDTVVCVKFSESVIAHPLTVNSIRFENENSIIAKIGYWNQDFSTIELLLTRSLNFGVEYNLIADENITDIAGNYLVNNEVRYMKPSVAGKGDVVINEVLFNPKPGECDFVELYNRSAFTVNLKQLLLASFDDKDNLKNICRISTDGRLLFPEEYIAVSESGKILKQAYFYKDERAFTDVAKLPSMPDDNGNIVLVDTSGTVLDYFYYDDNMHFAMIDNTEGISLERIDYNTSAQQRANWHSASEACGGATPGYKNSMYVEMGNPDRNFTVTPEVFTPNGDGIDDVVLLNYSFNSTGNVVTVSIFDSKGHFITYLANNELMSAEGHLLWDGTDNNGDLSPAGIYIVFVEIYRITGETERIKRVCTINY